jgi:3-oxoacyl-[acyl-carrier protein] reductase
MFTPVVGRSVVVTGGTRGIGKGIARVFSEAGANVTIVGRDLETGHETAAELCTGGADVRFVQADVSRQDECEAIAAAAIEAFGGIDVLCANAGIFPDRRLGDMSEADIDEIVGVNLKGSILAVQACLGALRRSGRGRVILTSSITGPITGFPGWSHYGATKAAQLGFMRTAALELAADAITVNAVLPGNVLSEGLIGLGDDYVRSMTASIPLGRLGTAEEIGYAVLFLATDEARWITGQSIVLDGGQTLPESLSAVEGP